MLYAQMDKKLWGNLPMEWDKTQSMFSYLDSMRYLSYVFYQLIFESSMFGIPPNYRCALVRWSASVHNLSEGRKRETMIESSDPKQVEAVLLMLISIAEEEKRARGG